MDLGKPLVEQLVDDIVAKRTKELEEKITRYPRSQPILSDIGECDRQIVYSVTHWEKRSMHTPEQQARMDVGNLWEREIKRDLEGLGFTIILSQDPVVIPGKKGAQVPLARGKIDGFLQYSKNGDKPARIPFEVKSMNPNIFNQIKTLDDLQKKPWLRKYTRQIQMYLYGNNAESGIFFFTDCLGKWKVFPVYIDYAECELILKRLERVAENLKAGTLPERITYNEGVCGMCPFAAECLPDIENEGVEIINDEELSLKLDRLGELKPLAKEYEDIDGEVKDLAKHVGKDIIVGHWSILVKNAETTKYDYPDEVKKQYAVKTPCQRIKIVDNSPHSEEQTK